MNNEKGVQCSDNDDDGETGAGSRLAEMMQLMKVNNVFVMVSRYYGGVHLGPGTVARHKATVLPLLRVGAAA